MSTASTLRIIADAIEILENPTPMPKASTLNMELINSMVLLADNGLLESVIGVSKADKSATIAPEAGFYAEPSIAAGPAPKARKARKPKAAKMVDSKGRNVALNDYGTPMLSDAGTATKGQRDWAIANRGITVKAAAKMSMVEASNARKAHKA